MRWILDVNNLRAANDNSADIIINSKKQDPVKATIMDVTDKMWADAESILLMLQKQ